MKNIAKLIILAVSLSEIAFPQLGSFSGSFGSGATPNYNITITTTNTTVTVDSASHQIGHGGIFVTCRDGSGVELQKVAPAATPTAGQYKVTVQQSYPFLVTLTFGASNQSGTCSFNGSGIGIQGPPGAPGSALNLLTMAQTTTKDLNNDLAIIHSNANSALRAIKLVDLFSGLASSFSSLSGQPTDNVNLSNALNLRVPTTRTVTAGTGLTGGGNLGADISLALAPVAGVAGSYTCANVTIDGTGRVTTAASGSCSGGPGGSFNIAGMYQDTSGGSTIYRPDGTLFAEKTTNNTFSAIQYYPPSITQVKTLATDNIVCNRHTVNVTASLPLTLTSTPTIAAPAGDGQVCEILNSGTSTITLRDNDALAGTLLELPASSMALAPKMQFRFMFNLGLNRWVFVGSGSTGSSGLQAPATNGLVTVLPGGTTEARTITGSNGVIVSNGDGQANSPDISLPGAAKGTMIAHNGTAYQAQAPGTNGQILSYDSSTTTGVKAVSSNIIEYCSTMNVPTSSTTDVLLATIPVRNLVTGSRLLVDALFLGTGGAGVKNVRFELGSALLGDSFSSGSVSTQSSTIDGKLSILSSTDVFSTWVGYHSNGTAQSSGLATGVTGRTTMSTGTTVTGNQDLKVYGRVAVATDTWSLRRVCVFHTPPVTTP